MVDFKPQMVQLPLVFVCGLLTSSLRLLTSRTPLDPACPARATLPAAAAAAAAALRGFRAPDKKQMKKPWNGEQHFHETTVLRNEQQCYCYTRQTG